MQNKEDKPSTISEIDYLMNYIEKLSENISKIKTIVDERNNEEKDKVKCVKNLLKENISTCRLQIQRMWQSDLQSLKSVLKCYTLPLKTHLDSVIEGVISTISPKKILGTITLVHLVKAFNKNIYFLTICLNIDIMLLI